MRILFILLMLPATIACSQKKGHKPDSNIFLPGQRMARVANENIQEISGVAASAINPGLLWIHNDSGNGAEVFLVNNRLEVLMTCILQGVVNRDWEDITVGPGPEAGKSYVYVGEIGDNNGAHAHKYIYRFEEPELQVKARRIIISRFDKIIFRLPDGSKDTESLLIHPVTKDLYVISKREDPVYLYELKYPHATGDTLTARKVMPLPYPWIAGADFSADGTAVIMKTYHNVYYWKVQGDLRESLRQRPYILDYKPEPQGEAITFARDGSGYYTVSEVTLRDGSWLYFYPRASKISGGF